jgi:hypothetical protein
MLPGMNKPPVRVFVDPQGNDRAAGAERSPVATVEAGLRLLRQKRRAKKGGVGGELILRGGVHELRRPVVLDHRDSGEQPADRKRIATGPAAELVIRGEAGEHAVLSGGRRITGWRETTINGRPAWVASLPTVRRGKWTFHQLWVNGRRATRTRWPKNGLLQIDRLLEPLPDPRKVKGFAAVAVGQSKFAFTKGDMPPVPALHNPTDIEFVALHFWIESRVPLKSIDLESRRVELQWPPRMRLTDDFKDGLAYYYLENMREALTEPGQWYLDRPAGLLHYLPLDGETMRDAEVVAPALPELIRLQGDPAAGRFVEHVRIENLTLSHNEYLPDATALKATPQAACHVPGAVVFSGARRCTIHRCTVDHVGSYGVEFTDGSFDCEATRCIVRDAAAGGIKVFHAVVDGGGDAEKARGRGTLHRGCRRVLLQDNHLHDGGHRWRQAVGVLVGKCSGVRVLHNHIHDFDYTGISVGWTWGYAEGDAYGNIVEYNHIHRIGRGVLSDMGGIYTLGVQPGTRLRYNLIHDIESRGYGGWGIYPDEGTSFVLIENNLVYRTKYAGFHTHFGKHNTVRNNIFALGRLDSIALGRYESHDAFAFERNIVLAIEPELLSGGHNNAEGKPMPATFEGNLYWCITGKPVTFAGRSFRQWRALGRDEGSVVADPRFADPEAGDFRLPHDSPAITRTGFVPFDLSTVGPLQSPGCDTEAQ